VVTNQNNEHYLRKDKAFKDSNDPRLIKRFHKWAHKVSEKTGFAERLAEFEDLATGFPKPPELLFST
jgi:hypothetical protein